MPCHLASEANGRSLTCIPKINCNSTNGSISTSLWVTCPLSSFKGAQMLRVIICIICSILFVSTQGKN
jgi:hypothetical protein